MRFEIRNAIGAFVWSLAILAGSLPADSVAAILRVTTTDRGMNYQPAVRAVSYSAPIYATYARPTVNDASISDKLSVSTVPEVGSWTMLAAILGLIGMRLWRGDKKNLPVIK